MNRSDICICWCWTAEAGEGQRTISKRKRPKSMVDVGCGIGGSSRYIAAKYGAKSQGITLSPFQAQRANALAAAQGLSDKVIINIYFLTSISNNCMFAVH